MAIYSRHTPIVLLALLLSCGARANDTSAALETGGLRFQKDADIVMRSEDLRISEKEIRIVYRFFNNAAADKTILIAFPMPDITMSEYEPNIGLPTKDPENIFGFHVTADDRTLTPHLQQTALAKGVDQSARLHKLGVPLMPYAANLDRLPKAIWPELVALGIGRIESFGTGREPMQDHLEANWTLASAYTWTQTFPGRRETVLEQTYRPSIGGSVGTSVGDVGAHRDQETSRFLATFCIDDELIRKIERVRIQKRLESAPYSERHIAYVLKTGANWAGPIGDFHLTVDKGAPDNLVSFCADGVEKTGPTRFEVHRTNFIPTRDLNIVIFVPYPH